MNLSDISIKRPVFASMTSAALVLFGVMGYRQLAVREFPDVDPPIVSVSVSLRGANPQVMESAVTDVLEEQLASLEGLRTMTSSSSEQNSYINLEFNLDRPIEDAAQDVRDLVSRVRGRLPQEIDEPVVSKQDADARPMMFIGILSDTYDLLRLSEIADRIIKPRLQTVPGLARAEIRGERRYAMRIWLSVSALAARGLTVQDVVSAIQSRNVEIPAGRIESDRREFSVRSMGQLSTPEEFTSMVVANSGGQLVKLGDVARVELGAEDDRSIFRFNGRPAVGLALVRQSKSNLVDVADAVRAAMPELQAALPPGVTATLGYDQSIYVKRSIKEAEETLILAAGLVVLIIFVFLRNVRATIIPGLAIPGLDRRHLRGDERARLLDQQPHAPGPDARDRHRGGRCHHRAGERLPPPGGAARPARAGGDEGHPRNRLRRHRHHDLSGGRLHSAGVPHRQHRPALQGIRHRGGRVGGHLRIRGAHAHPDALRQDPPGAPPPRACSTRCSKRAFAPSPPDISGPSAPRCGTARSFSAELPSWWRPRSWCSPRSRWSSFRPKTGARSRFRSRRRRGRPSAIPINTSARSRRCLPAEIPEIANYSSGVGGWRWRRRQQRANLRPLRGLVGAQAGRPGHHRGPPAPAREDLRRAGLREQPSGLRRLRLAGAVRRPEFQLRLAPGRHRGAGQAGQAGEGPHQRRHRPPGEQAGAVGVLRPRPRRGSGRAGPRRGRHHAGDAGRLAGQHLHPGQQALLRHGAALPRRTAPPRPT